MWDKKFIWQHILWALSPLIDIIWHILQAEIIAGLHSEHLVFVKKFQNFGTGLIPISDWHIKVTEDNIKKTLGVLQPILVFQGLVDYLISLMTIDSRDHLKIMLLEDHLQDV